MATDYTLKLDDDWDIYTDSNGNIATCTEDYAIAQNVANSIRLFTEDAYYDQERGIPHFDIELKPLPSLSVLRSRIREAALAVDGVEGVSVDLDADTYRSSRKLSGELSITTKYTTTTTLTLS